MEEEIEFLSASTISDSDLKIEQENNEAKFTIIKTMEAGRGFGETSMMTELG